MTLYALLVYAVTSSTAISDSERMAVQFNQPSLTLVAAPQKTAPENIYQDYSQLIACDPDNCGKEPHEYR